MVLSKSDYSLPSQGETMDPTEPSEFIPRVAGLAVVLTVVAYVWQLASGPGVSRLNDLTSRLGFDSETGTSGPEVF